MARAVPSAARGVAEAAGDTPSVGVSAFTIGE
jgi:hypothetical protein